MQSKTLTRYNHAQLCLQVWIALVLVLVLSGLIPLVTLVASIFVSQGFALFEVYVAVKGKTPSKVAASAIQVGARIGIAALLFVFLPLGPVWMLALLGAAWICADALRYLYYLRKVNYALAWARYHGFIVLYPLGMTLENMIIWRLMQHYLQAPLWTFLPFLALYVALALHMYRYMLRQRWRFLSSWGLDRNIQQK